jgi:hypothetical protein
MNNVVDTMEVAVVAVVDAVVVVVTEAVRKAAAEVDVDGVVVVEVAEVVIDIMKTLVAIDVRDKEISRNPIVSSRMRSLTRRRDSSTHTRRRSR